MTPEHNDALHRVQRAHPNVRWVEEDGSVILYREDSKRFIYLVLGGSLIEEDAMAALAKLDAELAGAPIDITPDEDVLDPAAIAAELEEDEPVAPKRKKHVDAVPTPEESAPEHVSEGEPMMPVSVAMDLIEEALAQKDGE